MVTSFAVEFAAFEEVVLPQLAASAASNIVLIADARMATMALSDGSALPSQLGRDYVLFSPPVSDGVFHPKIILQVGRDAGRCFVSSANATGAGLGGNVEIAIEIECTSEHSAEQEIVRAVWRYLDALIPNDAGAARDAMTWARERAVWIDGAAGEPLQLLDDGTAMALLANPDSQGIGQRFTDLVDGEPVERLIIVSPYWDDALSAVAALEAALSPDRTSILLDVLQHDFPSDIPMPAHRDIVDISDWRPSRFTHAKLVIAVTDRHDHVLSGSANCTIAALGGTNFAGVNAEACLYRRVPKGVATAALDLDPWLEQEPFPVDELPVRDEALPLPLDEWHGLAAGMFETEGGRLYWRCPSGRWGQGEVVLSDADGKDIHELGVGQFTTDQQRLSIWFGEIALEPISFARVREAGVESARTYVNHRTALRNRRRETASGSVAKALTLFNDASDLNLWIHQAFDELCRADVQSEGSGEKARAAPRPQAIAEDKPDIRYMTYEEFMLARPARKGRGGRSDSALAGTHTDSVRALLNRLSGIGQATGGPKREPEEDDSWMDLGDEDGELSEVTKALTSQEAVDAPDEREPPDIAAYEWHVGVYVESLTEGKDPLGPRDVLRLRLWIMLLLYEARCPSVPAGMLASIDENGWPRLIVRIISAFFWGKRSAIKRLIISNDYEDMPIDFLECWATVLWALDAIVALVPRLPRNLEFLRRLPMLRAHIVVALGLLPDDFDGEIMAIRRAGLDAELGSRLGVFPTPV
jgi:hypothetical protein